MWKDIDERYQINEFGEIRNKNKMNLLKAKIDRYGYHQISIRKEGERKKYWYRIHRLVAEYFIVNKPENWKEMQVDHIDNNKINNHVSNLRFTTSLENCLHRKLESWSSNKSTGELYITKYSNGYMIRINRSDYKKQEWCSTIEEAILKRNLYIEEIRR